MLRTLIVAVLALLVLPVGVAQARHGRVIIGGPYYYPYYPGYYYPGYAYPYRPVVVVPGPVYVPGSSYVPAPTYVPAPVYVPTPAPGYAPTPSNPPAPSTAPTPPYRQLS